MKPIELHHTRPTKPTPPKDRESGILASFRQLHQRQALILKP